MHSFIHSFIHALETATVVGEEVVAADTETKEEVEREEREAVTDTGEAKRGEE